MMAAKGVPIIPGMSKALSSEQEGLSVADEIGYPIILKASNGGGGKGMRVVSSETEFQDAIVMATVFISMNAIARSKLITRR